MSQAQNITAAQLKAAVINVQSEEYKAVLRTIRVIQLKQAMDPQGCCSSRFPVELDKILGPTFDGLMFYMIIQDGKLAAMEVKCAYINDVEQVDKEARDMLVQRIYDVIGLLGMSPTEEPTVIDLAEMRKMARMAGGEMPDLDDIILEKGGHTVH